MIGSTALYDGGGRGGGRAAGVAGPRGRAVQVDPIKPELKAPGTKRLKLKCDEPLSDFAFNFSLRRYTEVVDVADLHGARTRPTGREQQDEAEVMSAEKPRAVACDATLPPGDSASIESEEEEEEEGPVSGRKRRGGRRVTLVISDEEDEVESVGESPGPAPESPTAAATGDVDDDDAPSTPVEAGTPPAPVRPATVAPPTTGKKSMLRLKSAVKPDRRPNFDEPEDSVSGGGSSGGGGGSGGGSGVDGSLAVPAPAAAPPAGAAFPKSALKPSKYSLAAAQPSATAAAAAAAPAAFTLAAAQPAAAAIPKSALKTSKHAAPAAAAAAAAAPAAASPPAAAAGGRAARPRRAAVAKTAVESARKKAQQWLDDEAAESDGDGSGAESDDEGGRGLHSFTSQLNLSGLYGIGAAQLERFIWDRGCA